MNKHTKDKHEEVCFKCEKCEFQATNAFNLKMHTGANHENKNRIKCSQCKFVCNSKVELNLHLLATHGEKTEEIKRNFNGKKTEILVSYKYHINYDNYPI